MFNRPSRGNVRRRVVCRYAAVVAIFAAAFGMNSAANAAPLLCPEGQYSRSININTAVCQAIAEPQGTPNQGQNIPGVTLVGVNVVVNLAGGNDGVALRAINRSDCAVDYSAASAGMLTAEDMRPPPLTVSAAEPAYPIIAANEEFVLTTSLGGFDINNIAVYIAGQRFYSLPTGGNPPTITDAAGDPVTAAFGSPEYDAACLGIPLPPPGGDPGGNPPAAPAPGGDGNARDLAVVGLGVGVVGFMAAYLSGGDFSLFNFAPDYGYSLTESGYAYNVGGRLNFRKDGWHLYYAAGQANSNGEFGNFRYESGGEYSADLWTAAFSETVQGETADYDFALSADYKGGIWEVSPTYRLHSHLTETDNETDNALNLEGILRYNRWTISPSAGFRWESAEEFGDNARFNLSAVRRF